MERITIIGLGLIGSSLGLALKKAGVPGVEIVGHDKEPQVAGRSARRGAVHRVDWNLISSVQGARLVILAVPVLAIRETLERIGEHLSEDCVVTDTGSTKAQVLAWADELLPPQISFVGGHPMAGKEASGPEAADADLFQEATYCIIPSPRAKPEAVKQVVAMAEGIGARPFFLDAAEHDSFVAAVSHLPIVISSALVSATTRSPSWREMSRLAATGYRDVSRLASGDPEMNRDICLSNKEGILYWIDQLIEELVKYKRLMSQGAGGLGKVFEEVREARERWLRGLEPGTESRPHPDIPGTGERLTGMFVGESLARRARRLERGEGRKK